MKQTRLQDKDLDQLVDEAHDHIDASIERHDPSHVFALFSGGHDSVVATHVAQEHGAVDGVVHVNTGVGIRETREYVRSMRELFSWDLLEYEAEEHADKPYEEICRTYGMPGPDLHNICWAELKLKPIRALVREHKTHRHDRIMMITGIRRHESARRFLNADYETRVGAQLYTAPLMDWTGLDTTHYISDHEIPRNPVADLIGMSGECLCGAFADDDKNRERQGIVEHTTFDHPFDRISDLEDECREKGLPCEWGKNPSNRPTATEEDARLEDFGIMPMCADCELRKGST